MVVAPSFVASSTYAAVDRSGGLANPAAIQVGVANVSTGSIVPIDAVAAVALPSIPSTVSDRESRYGGRGDKPHLGGFTEIDTHGISPATWTYMVETLGVKSILDVGCGRGISTSWFVMHGVDALCVEGSHDAREQTMLPDPNKQMVEHDFSRGPWWPAKTYDAIWCVEFLEHVRVVTLFFPACHFLWSLTHSSV
jgi:2-polyprenyl-3-methyl-5-hydroxy-6-metoxy-1,4-benzoquinol methylase